jgi:serine/threonine protein kinase
VKQLIFKPSKLSVAEKAALERETTILSRVNHPNLVRLHGLCTSDTMFQLIQEYCEGGTLFELLHNSDTDLSLQQQVKMSTDIALAMEYLHGFKPRIIHRDLKSLNLLLQKPIKADKDVPVTKVADFGLARVVAEGDGGSKLKMTKDVGTPHWMAPEVRAGNHYDGKVDVYSYAMVMFEIFAREPPFEEMPVTKIPSMVRGGGRPEMEALDPALPPQLPKIMESAWHQEPKKRPTFSEILKMLASVPGVELISHGDGAQDRVASGFMSKSRAMGPYNSVSL